MDYEMNRIRRDIQRIHGLCLVIVSVVVLILVAIVGYIAVQESRYARAIDATERAMEKIDRLIHPGI